MKIVACGAGGTGKTSTMIGIAHELGMLFSPSVSRSVFARWGLKESDQSSLTPEQQLQLQEEIFYAKLSVDTITESFVSDRSILDSYVYGLIRGYSMVSKQQLLKWETEVRNLLLYYDFVFYFPISSFLAQEDDFRQQGYGYAVLYDSVLYSQLIRFGVMCHTVPAGDVMDRRMFVLDKIGLGRNE
jgi:predicted ATPase